VPSEQTNPSAEYFVAYFRDFYGPTAKDFDSLDSAGRESLAQDLRELLEDWDISGDGIIVVASDYLEAVAVRR
jgi:hypothetical protein